MKKMGKRLTGGFTLIELVVVIVILGILMAVAIPKYIDITDKAKRAADKGQLGALRAATHMIYASNVLYSTLVTNRSGGTTNTGYWPLQSNVWAQLQSTNVWQAYGTNVTYNQSNGTWTVAGGE